MLNEAQKNELMELLKELAKTNYAHGKRIVALVLEATEEQRAQAKATVKDQAQTLMDKAKVTNDAKTGDCKCGEATHQHAEQPFDSEKLAEATSSDVTGEPPRPADTF